MVKREYIDEFFQVRHQNHGLLLGIYNQEDGTAPRALIGGEPVRIIEQLSGDTEGIDEILRGEYNIRCPHNIGPRVTPDTLGYLVMEVADQADESSTRYFSWAVMLDRFTIQPSWLVKMSPIATLAIAPSWGQ